MSDNENDSKPNSSASKRSLKTATTKLKTEALRRLQLGDAEYDEAKAREGGENGGSRESSNVALSTPDQQQSDQISREGTGLSVESDGIQKDQSHPEISNEQKINAKGDSSKTEEEKKDENMESNKVASGDQESNKEDEGLSKAEHISSLDTKPEINKGGVKSTSKEDDDSKEDHESKPKISKGGVKSKAKGDDDSKEGDQESKPEISKGGVKSKGDDDSKEGDHESKPKISKGGAKSTSKEDGESKEGDHESKPKISKGGAKSTSKEDGESKEGDHESKPKISKGGVKSKGDDDSKEGDQESKPEISKGGVKSKGDDDSKEGDQESKPEISKGGVKSKGDDDSKGGDHESKETSKDTVSNKQNSENDAGNDDKTAVTSSGTTRPRSGTREARPPSGKGTSQSMSQSSAEVPKEGAQEQVSTGQPGIKQGTGDGQAGSGTLKSQVLDPTSIKGDSGKQDLALEKLKKESPAGTANDKTTEEGSNVEKPDNQSSLSAATETVPSESKPSNSVVDTKTIQADVTEEKSDKISPPLSELPERQSQAKDINNVSGSVKTESKDKSLGNSVDTNNVGTDKKSVTKQDDKDGSSEDKVDAEKSIEDKKGESSLGEGETPKEKDQSTDAASKSDTSEKVGEIKTDGDKIVSGELNETDKKETAASKATSKDGENEEGKDDKKKKKSKKDKKNEIGEIVESKGETQQQDEEEAADDDVIQVEGEEGETVLPDDFYYDYGGLVSKPHTSEGIPSELLSLHHSFGYECTKRSNLNVMDEQTILFSAGNMIQLLNIKTQEQTYFRTTGGGGIGAIAIHPSRRYFAVAEKGVKPNINIFEYPSLKLHRVLREGTEEAYANLDFSPDGTQLASVGSAPDFMLTVWDWKNERIMLRYKAFSQDIYKVAFSPDNEGHVNTSGSGHIRFWTMADTFTGLKLQGMIGKFGAKEISDIEGFVELPDGKVLSGSDWGNMLLWEGGLIKVEISKKGKKTCHHGMIQQFFMDEGELMTIGVDGFVKVWDFESIDNADTNDEGALFEVDPMYELKVGTDVKLISMQKAVNSEAPIWYAQDAGGGIWKLDLSFTHTSHAPHRMFSFHAGCITGLDTSPLAHFVATSGEDQTVRVYDYVSKKQICDSKFNSGGSTLLWVPKIVDTKGTSILTGFADGVVRLITLNKVDLSQVRSKKSKSNYELTLTQVFKPHTKPVTVLTIDSEGELLATGSVDCTVFFFSVDDTYKPIGYVETASPVVSIVWSKKGKKGKSILVSCKDGTVLEVEAPQPGEYDTSKTFHLPLKNLKITEFVFKRVKDKLRKAEADAIKAKEKEAKRKKKEAERARRRERGLEDEEEEEEEEEEVEEEEEEEQHEPGPREIINGFYHGKSDKFFLSMDGWDAGYLYECEFDKEEKPVPTAGEDTTGEPLRSIPVDNSNDVPIRSVYLTHSGKFLMFGMDNGVIRIHPVEAGAELDNLSSYWSISIHDNHNGSITKIKTSFDDKYVFTSGADGNFFVHKFMDKAVKGLKISHKVSLPSPKKLIGEDGQEIKTKVDDIDDPNFYSIELEKQKAEHDRMVKLAEEKKQNVRRKITNLRRVFKQLTNRNKELPDHVQLIIEEFIIDPELKKELKAKTQDKIDLVHKELAWESEKHSIGLKKLQKRFKDEIECERIVLRAFRSEHVVCTFRASKPDYQQQLLQGAGDMNNKGGEGQDGTTKKSISGLTRQMRRQSTQDKLIVQQQQQLQQQQLQQQQAQGQSQLGGKVAKALEKAEARRMKRLNRQAQWDELYRNKPDENYEDPKDKSAIKEAKENMGDYKLKTAKDYVVPESQRVNAEKKRLQLLKLLDQIHQYKFDFNQSFLALRNKKIAIIKQSKENTVKIEEIQKKIDSYSRRPIPKVPDMKPDEQPEKRLEYTRDRLLEFKKELLDTTKQAGGHDDGGFGGFGGFGGGGEPTKPGLTKPVTQQRDRSISSVSVHSTGRPRSSFSGVTEKETPELPLEQVPEEPTPLELQMQEEAQIKLQYDQDNLIDNIKSMMDKFDADLRTLRHDKSQLEVALKCADLRQVTLFEEFMLLKEFEKRENVYANKVNTKVNEKDEMQDKVEDCQMKLESKKQEIEKLLEQEKSLYTTFSTAMGENNKFENFLTKVFKKKIKRAKKKPQTEEGSDDDSDEDDSDEDLSSSDEEDSDAEELDDSVCPPGCDQALFDHVCQLRERKLDLEELLADEKKASETLKKESDALVKKAKVIDTALNTAEADLEAFQREKQQKLNELDVVVILRLNQVQHMINNVIPQDLSQSLIFCAPGLNQLQYRIKELEKEKYEQKRLYREHRQKHVQLIRDKKVMESRIGELEEKVQNMMMLKFGRLVDLEKLETVTVNRTVEELKEKLRQQEIKSARDIAKWDSKIDSYKGKTTQLTRENTQRLDTFTILLQEKKELEQMLDSRQKSLGTEFTGARKADLRERQRLIQLVQLQAQEIDALKDEITLLSRKGGHILPPAQPPLPPGQTPIPNA